MRRGPKASHLGREQPALRLRLECALRLVGVGLAFLERDDLAMQLGERGLHLGLQVVEHRAVDAGAAVGALDLGLAQQRAEVRLQ